MTDYEQLHGKVDMSASPYSATHTHDIHGRATPASRSAAGFAPPTASSQLVVHHHPSGMLSTTSPSPLRSYAEWYLAHSSTNAPLHAVPTVEHFKQESRAAGRKQESYLWSLMQDIYTDAEQADQYHPDAIGIEAMQPHRRWFISQYAHLQNFLQRQPVLRRATLICRWLESTYRDDARQEPPLRGEEEVMLRQLILTHLRGGEVQRAITAATTYGSCVYSCVLSAAQLQTVREPWFAQTALVPLFGEYAHGELDQAWCGNEYRLDNLSQLYDESLRYRSAANASADFDAVIGAALCGNLEVLDAAFEVNRSWKDMAWCYLRSALVVAFTKLLMTVGGADGEDADTPGAGPVDGPYALFIEKMTGSGDDWAATFSQKLVQGLAARLQSTYLDRAPLEEQLQMRFILQTLTSMDGTGAAGAMPSEWFDIVPEAGSSEAARLITHVVLAQDTAYGETLSPHAVQVRAGASLATALARYAVFVALLPGYPFDEGLKAVTAMTVRLRDPRHRAGVYAAFIKAARDYELERRDLSRSELEEQEARLVRQFVTDDADPVVRAEVQHLLYQQVTLTEMLTRNKVAEGIMWQAMHAVSVADYVEVLRAGLSACCSFWLAQPEPELEAIADVSSILARRVLVALQNLSEAPSGAATQADRSGGLFGSAAASPTSYTPVTDLERSEATFWFVMSEACAIAARHAKAAAELTAARANAAFVGPAASSSRTLVYQLTQDEATLLHSLVEETRRAVRHGGAVVHRDSQCLSAVIWVVRQLTEEVALSMLANRSSSAGDVAEESPAPRDELLRMQQVYALVEELHQAGYLDPQLLTRRCATELYAQIRTMRVSYGQLVHQRQWTAALRTRAARQVENEDSELVAQ